MKVFKIIWDTVSMAYLYASTDTVELRELIDPQRKNGHTYHDLGIDGEKELLERFGFKPMCSAKINRAFSIKAIKSLAENLVKSGLCAGIESDGKVESYVPNDMEHRSKILSLSLYNANRWRYGIGLSEAAHNLFLYSNNPNTIRKL